MNRRNAIAGLGMLTLAGTALGQPKKEAPKPAPKADPRAALLAALQACLAKAAVCEAHCAMQLAAGDKTFARCAQTIADTLDMGWATYRVVARKSPNAKKLVESCAAVCKDCSAACAEHKAHFAHGMHVECKECMEACDACIKACAAYIAAA